MRVGDAVAPPAGHVVCLDRFANESRVWVEGAEHRYYFVAPHDDVWSVTRSEGAPGGEAPGTASIAGVGEAGAEKRSALPDDGSESAWARRYEKLEGVLCNIILRRESERADAAGLAGTVDLQAKRIATLEAVARIARAALQSVWDFNGPSTSIVRDEVEEALAELAATLPDEPKPKPAPVLPVPRTSLLNPKLMVERAGVAAFTTLRDFLDENADDEHARAAVLGLEPGASVTLAGKCYPTPITITRKAA